jgi:hypothetical protein
VNYTEILDALREFTSHERIEFLPLAPDAKPVSDYAPIHKYVLDFRRRHCFDNRRKLAAAVAERHLCCQISDFIAPNVMTLRLCREIIPMCGEELQYRKLTGTTRAFPNIKRILGKVDSCQAKCRGRCSGGAGLRTVGSRRNH